MRLAVPLLSIGLVAATMASPVAAQMVPSVLPDGTLLDVSATGSVSRVPDVATIRAGVVTQAGSAAEALKENAQRMDRTIAALKSAGISDRDLQTSNVSLQPQYRYAENVPPVITGYQASNSVSVRFRDVAKSGRVLDALVAAGANQIDGPNLTIDRPEAAQDEARTAAIRIARDRATLYARAAGLTVDRIVSISENGASPPPPAPPMAMMMRSEARDAPTRVLPGEQDVEVTVNVRFLLK